MGGQYKVLGVVGGKSPSSGQGGEGGEVAVWPFVEEVAVDEGVKEKGSEVKEESKGNAGKAKELETVRI
jgi:hypothetical protein